MGGDVSRSIMAILSINRDLEAARLSMAKGFVKGKYSGRGGRGPLKHPYWAPRADGETHAAHNDTLSRQINNDPPNENVLVT